MLHSSRSVNRPHLTGRFTSGRLPREEPLHQFVPLVELAFDAPRGEKTAAGNATPSRTRVTE